MQNLTRTAAMSGNEASLVSIECLNTSGFAGLQLVGNVGELCREGKERAKTVLEALGFKMGHKRILINFSPADSRKDGNHFDLPLAVSIGAHLATEELRVNPGEWLFAAELGLDGSLRPIRGLVPLILVAIGQGLRGVVVAGGNIHEITALQGLAELHGRDFRYLCFDHLQEVMSWLRNGEYVAKPSPDEAYSPIARDPHFGEMDLTPELTSLGLCTAVGGHSLLLRGTPGSGKSMFAQRLPSLLPRLDRSHHLEALHIYSIAGENIPQAVLQGLPPFRSPHHSSSAQSLLGTADLPGEMSLAHGGLLFLDELPEFRRDLLESLREPLETGCLHIARAHRKSTWPAKVQFIAACNNCPCGYLHSKRQLCRCSLKAAQAYTDRLSGPLLERIDIHYWMPETLPQELVTSRSDQVAELRRLCERGRAFMWNRWGERRSNAEADHDALLGSSGLSRSKRSVISHELNRLKVSSRSILRVLRIARTLADLDESVEIEPAHLIEAARWRRLRGEGLLV